MKRFSKIFLLFLFGLSPLANSAEDDSIAVNLPEAGVSIEGIVLVPNEERLKELNLSEMSGVVNSGVSLPGANQNEFLTELGNKFLGRPLTQEELIKIKRSIIRYYRRQHHPIVAVNLHQQDRLSGVVVVVIMEKSEENLALQKERPVSQEHLEKYYDIQSGDNIAQDMLLNNVSWLNTNPFRRTIVTFPPGSERGATDLSSLENRRFPVRLYAGGDNAGNRFTGHTRLYAGLTWDHAFGLNDVLSYQYTVDPHHWKKFQAHFGSYISLLPWKTIATLFGVYMTTHPGPHVPRRGSSDEGKLAQGSFRYMIPLWPLHRRLKQEATVGADYKNINTNLFFIDAGPPILSRVINITQMVVNYSLERAGKKNELEVALELFLSPGKLMANQSNATYDTLRPHAKNRYIYGRLTIGDVVQLPRCFTLAGLLRIQGASTPLLPSEQFGLGGYNTVRGYGERVANADEALCANVELRLPTFSLMKSERDECIFLGFIDYGVGYNLRPSPEAPSTRHLLGAGPGMRYQIDTHFSARVDYGFNLHKIPGDEHNCGKLHVGVVAIY